MSHSLQVTHRLRESLLGGMGLRVQGKSTMGLHKIYYGIFSGGNEGEERESSRWFGEEGVWKIEGKGEKRGRSLVNS